MTQFAYGVLLARIPLFMFQAVQAALLPRLSRLAAKGELLEFRAGLRRLMVLVLAVGVVGTIGAFVLGPFVLEVVYDADLTGRTLAMLALGSACYMVALALAQAVIALQGTRPRLPRLGHRRRRLSARDLAVERRRVPPGRDRAARLVRGGDDGVRPRAPLQAGERRRPGHGSMYEAITDMPLET